MNNSSRTSFLRQSTMDSALLWTMVLALSGVQQHAAAPPPSTVQVRVGQDAVLQCPLLDAATNTTTPSTLSWYRKAAGHGPELLVTLWFMNGFVLKYGDGVGPEKISAAANGSLTLRNSNQNDSAEYYCGIGRGNENKDRPLTLTKK